ncbi:MAG: hypothetical protein JW874_13595 [Spirochaetales bacterium]|nr:hypothetical protein [Spirochaetales bacterium]
MITKEKIKKLVIKNKPGKIIKAMECLDEEIIDFILDIFGKARNSRWIFPSAMLLSGAAIKDCEMENRDIWTFFATALGNEKSDMNTIALLSVMDFSANIRLHAIRVIAAIGNVFSYSFLKSSAKADPDDAVKKEAAKLAAAMKKAALAKGIDPDKPDNIPAVQLLGTFVDIKTA